MANSFNKNFLKRILKTQEAYILLFSLFLILLSLIYIFINSFLDYKVTSKIATMIITNIFIGRVPALSFGYASNLSHINVIFFNILAEMILVTFLYSIFVLSFKGLIKIKSLEEFFEKVKKQKDKHKELFERYGKFGLFIFVFIPFWMTGPIVGSIIGFLIGMKHYTVIFTVFLATIVSMTLWGLFLQEIITFFVEFDIRFIWLLLLFVAIFILIKKLKKRIK